MHHLIITVQTDNADFNNSRVLLNMIVEVVSQSDLVRAIKDLIERTKIQESDPNG